MFLIQPNDGDPINGSGEDSKISPFSAIFRTFSLSWASSGTSSGMRNRPSDAVLLRRDGGNQEVPPGGWATQEDHERVLRAVLRAGWPNHL